MDEKEKAMLFASVGKLENSLKKLAESAKEKSTDIRSFAKVLRETENLPTIDPETLRPVSEWELNPVNGFGAKRVTTFPAAQIRFVVGVELK